MSVLTFKKNTELYLKHSPTIFNTGPLLKFMFSPKDHLHQGQAVYHELNPLALIGFLKWHTNFILNIELQLWYPEVKRNYVRRKMVAFVLLKRETTGMSDIYWALVDKIPKDVDTLNGKMDSPSINIRSHN